MDGFRAGWPAQHHGSCGAELLQHHQHFLLEPLLIFLLVLQVALPLQLCAQCLPQLLDIRVYSIQLLSNGMGVSSCCSISKGVLILGLVGLGRAV